jgi:membrane protease YdiL (CAAX protease family)
MGVSARAPSRKGAVLEVVTVTALAHAAYKALKLVEPQGQNFAPGLVLILAAAALLWIHRRNIAAYGIFTPAWRESAKLGVAMSAVIFGLWLIGLRCLPETSSTANLRAAGGSACIAAAAWARSGRRRRLLTWFRPAHVSLVLAGILVAIAWIAVELGATPARAATDLVGRVFFTGFGEELFFRGYVQSRMNEAFGRPVRILDVACGPGILISSALFGIVHLLNPTLYFNGHWEVAWTWGAAAFGSGLVLGFLREMTSSIWAGVLMHGTSGACGAVR